MDNYFDWRINIHSKGRALLMLFLFSDVTGDDAPAVVRMGSHLDVANLLAQEAEVGLSFMEIAQQIETMPDQQEALATGPLGTVYLCHPFIVHAAQNHTGKTPKFMAQPPLQTKCDFNINRPEQELSPVEKAFVKGIAFGADTNPTFGT